MNGQKPPPPGAGWYPDQSGIMRWWDGSAWTDHVHVPDAGDESDQAQSQPSPTRRNRSGRRGWRFVAILLAVLIVLGAVGWSAYSADLFAPDRPTVQGTSLTKTVSRVGALGAGAIPKVMSEDEMVDQYLQSVCGWNQLLEYQDTLIARGQFTYAYVRPLTKRLQRSARRTVDVLGPHPGRVWSAEFDDDRRKMREEFVAEFTGLRGIRGTTTEADFWASWNKWAEKDSGKAFQRFKLDIGLPTSTKAACKREGYWKE